MSRPGHHGSRPWPLVLGGLGAIGASYLGVASGRTTPVDDAITASLRARGRAAGDRADRFVGAMTDLGSVHALAGAGATLAATGRWHAGVRLLAAGGTAWTLAQGLKPALDRPRPYQQGTADRLVAPPAGSSWPSGHAALATAGLCALWPWLPTRARIVGGALVAGVGASRLHVGVHHASDVVAGVGVGMLAALIARVPCRRRATSSPS